MLLQLYPDWSPAQVKSALVNRADLVVKDAVTGTHDVGPTLQGGGRENLSVAADATTWMDPASASFGRVTVGRPTSVTITLNNPTGTDRDVQRLDDKVYAGHVRRNGPEYLECWNLERGRSRITVPASVTVPANGSTTLTVTVNAPQGASGPGLGQS